MDLLNDLLDVLDDGEVLETWIGLHWTAVVADVNGECRCGLASTLHGSHSGSPPVPDAGHLETRSGTELASLLKADGLTLRSVGMATVNALLPRYPESWSDQNAEDVIANHGEGRRVALVGRFPFVSRLEQRVGELFVFEKDPGEGEYSPEECPHIISSCDVVAITGMTLINHTLEGLLEMCAPDARVLILGPSTPLSPVLFEYGVSMLSGAVVTDIASVLRAVGQAATFRQVHREIGRAHV